MVKVGFVRSYSEESDTSKNVHGLLGKIEHKNKVKRLVAVGTTRALAQSEFMHKPYNKPDIMYNLVL